MNAKKRPKNIMVINLRISIYIFFRFSFFITFCFSISICLYKSIKQVLRALPSHNPNITNQKTWSESLIHVEIAKYLFHENSNYRFDNCWYTRVCHSIFHCVSYSNKTSGEKFAHSIKFNRKLLDVCNQYLKNH